MYETPRLTRLGTFRELTLQGTGTKSVMGTDLALPQGNDCAPGVDPNCRS
jgi:hypothetical protein